jgi:hypothetical protein
MWMHCTGEKGQTSRHRDEGRRRKHFASMKNCRISRKAVVNLKKYEGEGVERDRRC